MPAALTSALDRAFGVHAQALQFRSARSQVLAANLANADTPNYKSRDIEFKHVMGQQGPNRLAMAATNSRHIRTNSSAAMGNLMYRNPYQPSLDGNTVEAEVEQANFARNAVQYQASLMFLTGRIRGLRSAIQGGQ